MASISEKLRPFAFAAVVLSTVVGVFCVINVFRHGDPAMMDAYLFEEDGRVYLTVVESRTFSGGRGASTHRHHMTVYDPATGEALATTELTERDSRASLTLYRREGARLWTRASEHGVRLLDLRTAEVLLDEAAIVRAIPELEAGIRPIENLTLNDYSPPTAGLPLTLHDGRQAWLAMDPALRFEPVPTDPWKPGYFCGPDGGAKPSCERTECIAFQSAEGTTGMVLGTAPIWNSRQVAQVDPRNPTTPDGAATEPFLKPGLVRLHETECALELEGDVLVLHDSASFDPKEPLLSRARRDGSRAWTVPVAGLLPDDHPYDDDALPEPFEAVVLDGDLFVLLTEPRVETTLAVARVDPDSGARRSSFVLVEP